MRYLCAVGQQYNSCQSWCFSSAICSGTATVIWRSDKDEIAARLKVSCLALLTARTVPDPDTWSQTVTYQIQIQQYKRVHKVHRVRVQRSFLIVVVKGSVLLCLFCVKRLLVKTNNHDQRPPTWGYRLSISVSQCQPPRVQTRSTPFDWKNVSCQRRATVKTTHGTHVGTRD